MDLQGSRTAYRIRAFGKVQGVWFRKHTAEQAGALGVKGWVRNEADGSVLIHAEGATSAVEELARWCAMGPPQAEVKNVRSTPTRPEGYAQFTIHR